MNEIGNRIARLRKGKGYTQEKLAEILHISPQAISKWENGHTLPESVLLPALSKLLGCTIDSILMPQSEQSCFNFEAAFEKQTKNILQIVEERLMTQNTVGLDDNAIINSIHKIHGDIGICTVRRHSSQKTRRSINTNLTVSSLQKEIKLIEKVLFGNDTELYRLAFMNEMAISIPRVYLIDLENKILLTEDCSEGYIQGFVFDEANEAGDIYRRNYNAVLEAIADLHIKCWDNYGVFAKTGLPWHLDNFSAHLKSVEKDYNKYRTDNYDKADKKQFDRFENALSFLHNEYPSLIQNRFHEGKNITVIHGDFHPGNTFISKTSKDPSVKIIDFEAVRMGLCTDDLVMFLAFHAAPSKKEAIPLLESYFKKLSSKISGYSFDDFLCDYKASITENLFIPVALINAGIPAYEMVKRALIAYEAFI